MGKLYFLLYKFAKDVLFARTLNYAYLNTHIEGLHLRMNKDLFSPEKLGDVV